MIYLVQQIILCLLFTAVIGATVGWLLRGLGTRRQADAIDAQWRSRIAQIRQENRMPPVTEAAPASMPAADNARLQELQQQLRKRDEIIAALQSAKTIRSHGDNNAADLADQLRDTTRLCNQLQGHVAEQRAAVDQLMLKMERANEEKEMLTGRLREREAEIGRMSQERQHAINTIAKLQKEIRSKRGEQLRAAEEPLQPAQPLLQQPAEDEGSRQLSAGDGAVAATPSMPATGANEVPAAPSRQVTGINQPAATPPVAASAADVVAPKPSMPATAGGDRQQNLPIADSSAASSAKNYRPPWLLNEPNGKKDNLQAIHGVGPKLETQLNNIGIYHFEQIARFNSHDILWVARHLKSFPGRIVRDQWIQQAQTFLQKN